jgi:hypothetical protein
MYTVIQTIQSTMPHVEGGGLPDPVEVRYYTGNDKVQAISALVSSAATAHDKYFTVLAVRMEMV